MRFAILLALVLSVTAGSPAEAAQDPRDALQPGFFQSQGAHFTILFEGPQDYELAGRALEVLEAAYFRIGTALYTFPAGPITVVLYTQQQFRDITRAPAWAAGAYDGHIRIPIRGALARPEELERVLSHELVHAMIQAIAPAHVPTWLNEGLAVTFEANGVAAAQAQLAGSPHRLPFSRLSRNFEGLSGDDARLAYAQSAVIAQRLLDEGGGSGMLAILQDLAAGIAFERAYEQRLFLPFATFTSTLNPSR
jgi:hypothetical protein